MIKVVLFANLREELGIGFTEVPDSAGRISGVIRCLTEQHGDSWAEALAAENVLVAVNQSMVKDDHVVAPGDEVAFFLPVTGG